MHGTSFLLYNIIPLSALTQEKHSAMKIDNRKKVRDVAGEHIVIMQADGTADMTKVVALNDTALALYHKLKDKDFTVEDVTAVLEEEYDVDHETAAKDAAAWVESMKKEGMVI